MNTKNEIKFGDVELEADEFDPKHCKLRVTMMVDEDIVKEFKRRALECHEGYQTLINRALRESISKPALEERLSNLESVVKELTPMKSLFTGPIIDKAMMAKLAESISTNLKDGIEMTYMSGKEANEHLARRVKAGIAAVHKKTRTAGGRR